MNITFRGRELCIGDETLHSALNHPWGFNHLRLENLREEPLIGNILSCGRCSGLMISALVPGASGPGLSPGQGPCVVFLGKTLNSHSAPLYPGV